MKVLILLCLLAASEAGAFPFPGGSQINSVNVDPDSVVLGADTSGRYVGNITSSDGITTNGASNGEDISHHLAIDQSFEPTWTGAQAFTPTGTKDIVFNIDTDSSLRIIGTATAVGTFLCLDSSNDLVLCNMNNSISLSTDTIGDFVGTLTAGTGINTSGVSTGEAVAHTISVDQTFSPTWTGSHAYFGGGAYTAQTFILDQVGDSTTRETFTNYVATGLAPGELSAIKLALIDTTGSTGGQIAYNNCQMIPGGSAEVTCMFAGAGIYPIVSATGTPPTAPSQGWKETAGIMYTNVTTAFGSTSSDVQLFPLVTDRVYVGETTSFYEIQVILAAASSHNLGLTFEYSTVSGWTTFSPNDGTLGFIRTGNVNFNKDVLLAGGWAQRAVNGVSKYYIRMTRTSAIVTTPPTEDSIILSDGIQNQWDPQGRITIQQITTSGEATNYFAGRIQLSEGVTVHTTCNATGVGTIEMYDNGMNKVSLCVCEKTGSSTYTWGAVTAGGIC